MSDCGCNENNDAGGSSLYVQKLSEEIKSKLQGVVTSIEGLETIQEVSAVVIIKNNKTFVLQSDQPIQPINLLLSPKLTVSTTYEVKRDQSQNICCAYEVTHYSDKRPSSWRLLCCEPRGQQHGDFYFSVNHKSNGKCCIYVQDIIPPVGGNGDPTLGPKREWKCEK